MPGPLDKDATIWVGKKYVRREDIHITDNIYQDISGMGAGIDYMQVGPGKLSLGAEQDTYGEIGLGTDVAKIDDTVWSVYTMFAYKTKIDGGSWQDNRAGADGNFGDDGANAGHWSAANGFRHYFVS